MAFEWKDDFWKPVLAAAIGWLSTKGAKKVVPFAKDVWKLKDVQKELDSLKKRMHLREEEMSALLHIMKMPMFINNEKMELIWVNAAWLELTGFRDPEDAYGVGYLRAVPERYHKQYAEIAEQMKRHPFTFTGTVIMRNIENPEKEIPCFCRTRDISDESGNLVKILGILIIQ